MVTYKYNQYGLYFTIPLCVRVVFPCYMGDNSTLIKYHLNF